MRTYVQRTVIRGEVLRFDIVSGGNNRKQNKVGKGYVGVVAARTGRVYEYHQKYDLIL